MKGRPVSYSKEELAWLHANHTMPIVEYFAAFIAQFQRHDLTAANINALRKRKGWRTGRTGHFVKGEVPHNKGKRCEEGKGGRHPNARKSQFKPGERRGVAVRLYKPIGSERISKGGYLERKIHDGLPLQSRWRAVHLLRWEEQNGPLPKGMALKCLDSDILNTDPSNWEMVPRAILPRLNGGRHKTRLAYDHAPSELRPTIMLAAKVEHRARQAQEKARKNG